MKIRNILKLSKEKPAITRSVGGMVTLKSGYEVLYEQINADGRPTYAVYSLDTQKTYVQPHLETENAVIKPFDKVPWTPSSEADKYQSKEQLWSDVYDCVVKHWDHSEPAYQVVTAFIHASWLPELWLASPFLFAHGPLESGKTRVLELLAELCFRGWLCLYTSPASLFRTIETWHPTLLLDEAETYADRSEITALLNGSYRRGALIPRQKETEKGYVTELFDCFGFKAVGGTKELADTLESRCIRFRMSRATRSLRLFIDKTETTKLRNQLLMYRFKKLGEQVRKVRISQEGGIDISQMYERFAEKLGSSRLAELFFPLIYVAPTNEIRNKIFGFAQELDKIKWEELTTSPESVVLRAIVEAYNEQKIQTGGRIKIGDISDVINENLAQREQWNNRYVSSIAKRLGFTKTYVHGRIAIRYDAELVERLKTDPRYKHCFDFDIPASGKTSPISPPHLKVEDWDEVFGKKGERKK